MVDTTEAMQQIARLRDSGNVRRAHVFPHHGEYSVGLHSYNALSMLLLLHPGPSIALVEAVLWHDAAEKTLGDLPATAKWTYPMLAKAYELAEAEVLRDFIPRAHAALSALTDEDRQWLSFVDGLELVLWCAEQVQLGRHGEPLAVVHRVLTRLRAKNLPAPMGGIVEDFVETFHVDRMTEEEMMTA